MNPKELVGKLESKMSDTSDLYVSDSINLDAYAQDLAEDIRRHLCNPTYVTATVMPPGFPDTLIGSKVSGFCVARKLGYWLVYQPDHDIFYCFWGSDSESLGAHGVYGSPLYCWSA